MTTGDAAQAQRLYRAGMEMYGRQAYEESLSAFDRVSVPAAYGLDASRRPSFPSCFLSRYVYLSPLCLLLSFAAFLADTPLTLFFLVRTRRSFFLPHTLPHSAAHAQAISLGDRSWKVLDAKAAAMNKMGGAWRASAFEVASSLCKKYGDKSHRVGPHSPSFSRPSIVIIAVHPHPLLLLYTSALTPSRGTVSPQSSSQWASSKPPSAPSRAV